jgi:hypothetical protein
MVDHSLMRLGKKAAAMPAHIPTMSRYMVNMPLPQPPAIVDWSRDVPWPMLANDVIGDCTCAAVLHAIQTAERWHDGVARVPSDDMAIQAYEEVAGYVPGHPETDAGAYISDVMDHWRDYGIVAPGGVNRITGAALVTHFDHLQSALWLMGPLVIGCQMPISAQSQDVWTSPKTSSSDNEKGSWGGHCMLMVGMDRTNETVSLVTWGGIKTADIGWIQTYMDEAWIAVQPAWVASGRTPSGILAAAIEKDMPV